MNNREHREQVALFRWAQLQRKAHPELALMFAIPNGGKRSISVAAKLKAEGVKAGVPDICLPVARCGYHGLFIELKAGDNNATDNQQRWLDDLTAQGYCAVCLTGWDAARNWIQLYLSGSI